jgi:hypothetical protein
MRKPSPRLVILFGLACVSPAPRPASTPARGALQALQQLPIRFEPNVGQSDPRVRFLARGRGYGIFLTATGPVLALAGSDDGTPSRAVHVNLVGSAPSPSIEAVDRLAGVTNFYGGDPSRWRAGVPGYARVAYRGLYPGVDLVFHGQERALEYDFVVAPGADPRAVRLAFDGADSLALDADGDLVVGVGGGAIEQRRPVVYQQIDSARREVPARWVLEGDHSVRFEVAAYDATRPLVIDPVVIAWSTYLGGVPGPGPMASYEGVHGIAVDAATGDVVAVGQTPGVGFPNPDPSHAVSGALDAYVVRIDATGTSVTYTTFLGGPSTESADAVAVDAHGNAFVMGTGSQGFPVLNAAQPMPAGGGDVFVASLDAAGRLRFSTFLGGSSSEGTGGQIAVDPNGRVIVTGYTRSTDFPTTPGAYDRSCGTDGTCNVTAYGYGYADAFVASYSADGALDYATYLGGERDDYGTAVTVDADGRAYVVGGSESLRFPWIDFLPASPPGIYHSQAFVSRLSADGSQLLDSTLLGGGNDEGAAGVAVDRDGYVVLAGSTDSTDLPLVNPIQSELHGIVSDVFVAKLDLDADELLFATYLGGDEGNYVNGDVAAGMALDANGFVYLAGQTSADDFPLVEPRQGNRRGWDAFVAKLDTETPALLYATILGGDNPHFADDVAYAIAVDANGDAYVGGMTGSRDFPVEHAIQPQHTADQFDGFLTKLALVPQQFTCDVEMGAAVYRDGDRVTATVAHFANASPYPIAARVRVSLELPDGSERIATEIGANANVLIPAGFHTDLAPVAIAQVTPGMPRGRYALRCEFADPGTGTPYAADEAAFALE